MARTSNADLAAVVMAAGRGRRLRSGRSKVLHQVCGRPALWHVLRAVDGLRPGRLVVVVSHGGDELRRAVGSFGLRGRVTFVDQGTPLGTGHAVVTAERAVGRSRSVLVVPGDNPLLTTGMLRDLLRLHERRRPAATVQTAVLPDATGYGRVVRDGDKLVRIVEEREASVAEREIREVATSVYVFRRDDLYRALPAVDRDNAQQEYYLPDVLEILADKGEDVRALVADFDGGLDINSRTSLAAAAAVLRRRINRSLLDAGVTLIDPDRTYVDVDVKVGADSVVHPMTFLGTGTRVGSGCTLGPGTRIEDSRIADGAVIEESVVKGARIGPRAHVGPFAHIRPGTVMAADTKAGSFVEIKASRIGEGSKVPHLAYVGDATIGRDVNVGAGTITCNYDGVRKHRTVIGDGAFIGSDTMLVAPVRVGKGATTGAGSTITKNVPPGALAVERADQRTIKDYRRRTRGRRAGGEKKRRKG